MQKIQILVTDEQAEAIQRLQHKNERSKAYIVRLALKAYLHGLTSRRREQPTCSMPEHPTSKETAAVDTRSTPRVSKIVSNTNVNKDSKNNIYIARRSAGGSRRYGKPKPQKPRHPKSLAVAERMKTQLGATEMPQAGLLRLADRITPLLFQGVTPDDIDRVTRYCLEWMPKPTAYGILSKKWFFQYLDASYIKPPKKERPTAGMSESVPHVSKPDEVIDMAEQKTRLASIRDMLK